MNSPKLHREFRSSTGDTRDLDFAGKSRLVIAHGTYLQFSDAAAAARTECWEDSACERGEKQVEVEEEEEKEKKK